MEKILQLQYLAYQSEAALFGTKDIPPLKQTLEEVRQEALRLREARLSSGMNLLRNSDLEREVVAVLTLNHSADALELSKSLSVSVSSVYKLLGTMVKKGTIVRAERGTGWRVV